MLRSPWMNCFRASVVLGMISAICVSSGAWAQKDAADIAVGAVFSMTGPIASYGQESVNGIKLALEKINKVGIKGKKIRLIVEDNKGEQIDSANSVRKLINVDNVITILGSVASSNTLAGAPIAQKAKVPMLTPASTNEKVTETGDYISRICFTDSFQGVVMAKFAREELKKVKAAIIVDNANDYSIGLAAVFKKKFEELGGKVIADEFAYQQKDQDFKSLMRRVRRADPDVVFLPGYYQEVGLILKEARAMKMDIPFLGGDGWDSPTLQQLAGKSVKNSYISSHFAADDSDPIVQNFVKEYKEKFQVAPGAMAALGFDAMGVLADALKRAGKMDHQEVKKAINSIKDYMGVTGKITLDEKRNAIKSAVVLKVTENGNIFEKRIQP